MSSVRVFRAGTTCHHGGMPTHEIRHEIEDLSIGEAQPVPSAELLEVRLELGGKPVGTKWAISAKANGPTDVASRQQLMRYRQGRTRWKTFGEVMVDRAPRLAGSDDRIGEYEEAVFATIAASSAAGSLRKPFAPTMATYQYDIAVDEPGRQSRVDGAIEECTPGGASRSKLG